MSTLESYISSLCSLPNQQFQLLFFSFDGSKAILTKEKPKGSQISVSKKTGSKLYNVA